MKLLVACLFCFVANLGFAQDSTFTIENLSINKFVDGALTTPNGAEATQLAILIAGSGPTDRNGNQNFLKNNALKKLAEGLTKEGIATFRYDKRIVKQILKNDIDPNTKFDDFVTDAVSVVDYFKNEGRFKKIYVIGHSQGSLVGMLASNENVTGFVSLAGAGQSIDAVILEQVAAMDSSLVAPTEKAFRSLKQGQTTSDYPTEVGS